MKGFLKLDQHKKELAYSTLACLYGLSGKEPVKFVVTHIDATDPSADAIFCISLAKKMGFKIFNLASVKGRDSLVSILKKIKKEKQ